MGFGIDAAQRALALSSCSGWGGFGLDSSLLNLGRPLGAVLATGIFGSIIAAAIAAAPALHESNAAGFITGMHRTALVAAVLSVAAALVCGSGRSPAGSARS